MKRAEVLNRVMMGRRRSIGERKSTGSFLDATPIGDLSFLLLIFFIVTSSFILREGVFFTLPSSRSAVVRVEPDQVMEVRPREEGFQCGGRVLSREAFAGELRRFRDSGAERVLIIRMDKSVRYDRLVDTLSVARETGMRKVSLQDAGGK